MSSTFTGGSSFRARVYDRICSLEEKKGLLGWRRQLVGGLSGEVVEIGAGTGLNFRHYPADAVVFASDRDPVMLGRAIGRGDEAGASVHIFVADAQGRIPLRDDSADQVVSGLMLCSVPKQGVVLAEVARILRPGGRFRFMEHVRDRDGSFRGRFQDALNPVWRRVSGGCNCNRRTVAEVERAGFEIDSLQTFKLGPPHVAPHVLVEAVLR
ncbi:MAG: class I SAM-dependent methyltransferase [Actinomycetota bacterium]